MRLCVSIVLAALSAAPDAAFAQAAQPQKFHINSQRLQGTLEKLSEFGRNPEGGVTRLAYSDTELPAREYVIGLMKQAGLEVRADPAGNLFGKRAGSDNLPVLLFGSHIDSVVKGGNFDGDVGSLGAIEVINALNEDAVKTRHPLEVVIWMNEEGNHFGVGTMGSGIAAGLIGPEILGRKDEQGLTVADWLRRYGQDPAHLTDARIAPGALAAYLELHIEQGPNLDETKIPIGVVQGIVGLKRWRCVATGFANHAGTTPMDRRKDALAAASRAVLAVRDVVRVESGRQVGTVGYMKTEPGAVNVIPGRVEFPIELRDLDAARIDRMWDQVQAKLKQIDKEENVETRCTEFDDVVPARTDPSMQAAIRDAAKSLGLATMDLPSGAVHDAQQMAKLAPFGMIFVPSRDGISHSPKEFTSWQDVANGAEVLYRSLLLVDTQLNPDGEGPSLGVAAERAMQQSKLTLPDSTPFHLKASVAEKNESDSDYQATIEEYWVSPTKWTRTIKSPDFSQTLVVNGDLVSEKNTGDYYPFWLSEFVTAILDPLPMLEALKQANVRLAKPRVSANSTTCADLPARVDRWVICFEGDNGLLISVFTKGYAAEFKEYKTFGDKRVARRILSDPEPGTAIEAEITELTELSSPDEQIFTVQQTTPLAERIKSVRVDEDTLRKLSLSPTEIDWPPTGGGLANGGCAVYVSADRNGNIREAWPEGCDNPGLQDPLREIVKKWHLKPAISDGAPVQVEALLGFTFHTNVDNSNPLPELSDAEARDLVTTVVEPVFPPGSGEKETEFVVQISVDEAGKLAGIQNTNGLKDPIFLAIDNAVMKWHFKPYIKDGKPQYFHANIVFHIH